MRLALIPLTALASATLACTTDQAVQTGQLDPDDIARLAEKYPVLGADSAPEPQPSDNGVLAIPASMRSLPRDVLETVRGEATYYADKFEGRRTASGIPFRQNQMVAAHRLYPFGTLLRVTNTRNDRSVNVRVVDRGPHGKRAAQRNTIIDLSRRAAEQLGYIDAGRTPVKVEVLEWGEGLGT
jgi:rare lipoprotein A